ncbi:hypothetical protein NC99_38060 [Sunxiuqinia dokdonensis]|uniref:Uncharacterized protein n=1 Tax=Sunxiuqinia dokdonensis TaxID=1409788 RepID=A0A0L8V4L8_9BACT|nr:hypothetical protein NC99_38060 [Sunxiuqinia dokdonensis]
MVPGFQFTFPIVPFSFRVAVDLTLADPQQFFIAAKVKKVGWNGGLFRNVRLA